MVKAVTITELAPGYGDARRPTELATELRLPDHAGVVDREVFETIYNPGKLLLLAGWKDEAAAAAWRPRGIAGRALRHRVVRIIRDYSMTDRREAPQYYPPVSQPPSQL